MLHPSLNMWIVIVEISALVPPAVQCSGVLVARNLPFGLRPLRQLVGAHRIVDALRRPVGALGACTEVRKM